MSTILELREKMAQIATNARSKLDEIKNDTTEDRAAEIETEFDAMMAEHDKIGARVEREEKIAEAEARALEVDESKRPNYEGRARGAEDDSAPSYKDMFVKMLRVGVGEMSAEERSILRTGQTRVEQGEQRAQSVGTESAGGYTVPEEFSGEIDKALAMWGPMYDPGVTRELNTSNGRVIKWPTVDDTANTGRIKAENASVDDDGTDDVTFGEKQLDAYVYDTGMVKVPLELLQDSAFDMETLLRDLFAERLGRLANSVLTTGSGSSAPHGIVTAATTAGVTTASATAFTSDELIDLLHSVDPMYRMSPRTRWMFNDDTLARIRKLKDGQGNYLWQMGDIRAGEPNRILGHAYSINQAMASLDTNSPNGGEKPILFGDFNRYIVRKVIGFQLVTLRERYAENFQIGLVGFKRFDGELLNTGAVKHLLMTGG